jgi:hypothetical protein
VRRPVQLLELRPQFPVLLALRLSRPLDAAQDVALHVHRVLRPPQLPAETLLLGGQALDLVPSSGALELEPPFAGSAYETDHSRRHERGGDVPSCSMPAV